MLVRVRFGPGGPRAFSIAWRASTEAAAGAEVSWEDTGRLRGKKGNQMCLLLFHARAR